MTNTINNIKNNVTITTNVDYNDTMTINNINDTNNRLLRGPLITNNIITDNITINNSIMINDNITIIINNIITTNNIYNTNNRLLRAPEENKKDP